MALPRGDQYNEAVQNPAVSFFDADLKASKVETDSLGLPKPYSGGFMLTFKLQHASDNWAVRCMIRDNPGLQQRYQSISDFFSRQSSPYFIDAKFLPNGIKVNGSPYPIIKMKWMDGDPLNIYVSNHYKNKDKVTALLNDFQNMIGELERLGIAHGDLQQGNIIVKNGKIYLIDYDGMYLPALQGMLSNEVGHPNFQHPQRTGKDFNEKIDRFSAIVIYLSLKALIYKPTLWNKYHNSDNLIIKSSDIGDLNNSPVIADLTTIPEIKPLVNRFIGVCHLDFSQIPSLKDYISGNFAYDKSRIGKITIKGSLYYVLDGRMKATILEHFGERVEVVGLLSGIHKGVTIGGKPYYFLNMGRYPNQTFTITLWSEGINSLTSAGLSPESLVGKWVSIIGVITSYRSQPQTVAEQASQIQILPNEQEAQKRLQLKKSTATQYPPTSTPSTGTPPQKKVLDKEAQVFGDLYKNIPAAKPPVTKPPVTTPLPKSTPPTRPTPNYGSSSYTPPSYGSKNTQYSNPPYLTSSSSESTNKSGNNGCLILIVCAVLGGIIAGSITNGKSWFVGVIIGGIIGSMLYSAFK
jgi:hypothetical protein